MGQILQEAKGDQFADFVSTVKKKDFNNRHLIQKVSKHHHHGRLLGCRSNDVGEDLDELEKALGRLDPAAAAGDAKVPAMTSVYDPITKGIKLVTMEQYERHYPKIPAPSYVAMYNPEKQCVELMFESAYLASDAYKKDLQARKPKAIPEYTCVYDPVTQESKLMLWDKFVSAHKPPTASFAMKYNAKKQGIDLVFWRNY